MPKHHGASCAVSFWCYEDPKCFNVQLEKLEWLWLKNYLGGCHPFYKGPLSFQVHLFTSWTIHRIQLTYPKVSCFTPGLLYVSFYYTAILQILSNCLLLFNRPLCQLWQDVNNLNNVLVIDSCKELNYDVGIKFEQKTDLVKTLNVEIIFT